MSGFESQICRLYPRSLTDRILGYEPGDEGATPSGDIWCRVVQLVERQILIPEIAGSSPATVVNRLVV